MAHFYGWTDDYIESLPINIAQQYYDSMSAIKARETLTQYNVMMAQHWSKADRDKFVNGLVKQSNPVRKSKGVKISNKELMEVLVRR